MTQTELKGIKIPVLVTVEVVSGKTKYVARDNYGNEWTDSILLGRRKGAVDKGGFLQRNFYKDGTDFWKHIDKKTYDNFYSGIVETEVETVIEMKTSSEKIGLKTISKSNTDEVLSVLKDCYSKKPKELMMSELKWKYLVRCSLRGKNILMVGPSGCGKTLAAKTLVNTLERPDFYFNLGATQDPRLTLIGNTHYDKESGTMFEKSLFVKAIETQNAIILLDEVSRANPEAWNILMTVLDEGQRYLRLDEEVGSPTIKVADGVCFIGTANVGTEYTSTRIMDRALLDRFTQIEMDSLNKEQEYELYTMLFPSVLEQQRKAVSEIVEMTRTEIKTDDPKITSAISTRMGVEIISLMNDGFNLMEAAEVTIFPFYPVDGGADSERMYMTQLVQKYVVVKGEEKKTTTTQKSGGIFSVDDIAGAAD